MLKEQQILVAFGGNLPLEGEPPLEVIERALSRLQDLGFSLNAVSSFYQTPCFPKGAGPDYVNGALSIGSDMAPAEILEHLHKVEYEFGRERVSRWAGRTLDLDLLAVDDLILPDLVTQRHWVDLPLEQQTRQAPEQLILPHPRIQDRSFVLIPLKDVAPDWKHPVLGKTVQEMCAELPKEEVETVVRL